MVEASCSVWRVPSRAASSGAALRRGYRLGPVVSAPPRRSPRQPNSTWLYSRNLCNAWRALTNRTVPDCERMTRDWVLTP